MRTLITVLMAALAVATPSLAAAQDDTSDLDRFDLFNRCQPMGLLVEGMPNEAADINLTKERIQTMAESRLRAARLYEARRSRSYLYINVNLSGRAFNVSVDYKKVLYDAETALFDVATTWSRGLTGTHGGEAGYILQGLSEHLDRFVLEYLRVNEEACDP